MIRIRWTASSSLLPTGAMGRAAVQMKLSFEKHEERFEFARAQVLPERQDVDTAPLEEELARVITVPGVARMIIDRAGLPPQLCPPFDRPDAYWYVVVKLFRDGAAPGGVPALAAVTARRYPGNKVFARYRSPP